MEADSWDCRTSFISRECSGETPKRVPEPGGGREREGERDAVQTFRPWQLVCREVEEERGTGMEGPGPWSCTGVGRANYTQHLSHHIILLLHCSKPP